MAMTPALLAGLGAQLAGVIAWRQARGGTLPMVLFWLGLVLLAASLPIYVTALGASLGLSWALLTVSLAAYAVFLPRLLPAAAIGRPIARQRSPRETAARGGKLGLALRLFAAGPLYLIAALAVGAVLATKLPWSEVNRLMLGGLVIPLVWALGALHATADLGLVRVLGMPLVITAIFAGGYFTL
jgi:hypothetical protein